MILRIRDWYSSRSRREQWMLAAMSVLALAVLAWLLVVRPLDTAYDASVREHLEAVDRHGRVLALADQIRAGVSRASLDPSVDLQLVVTESAGASGLTLSGLSPAGGDSISVTLSNVGAAAATQWLRDVEARGLAIVELRMAPAGEGGVNVSARLARR